MPEKTGFIMYAKIFLRLSVTYMHIMANQKCCSVSEAAAAAHPEKSAQ